MAKKRRRQGLHGGVLKATWLGWSARVAVPSETLGGIRRMPLIRYSTVMDARRIT
jgi:hypothetical protein